MKLPTINLSKAIKSFKDFWGRPPKTEDARFERWICSGVAADGTEFEHEGGWVLVTGLKSEDAIPWLMMQVKHDGYFRDAHLVFPLSTVAIADWSKAEEMSGPIPYGPYDLQINFTRAQVLEKLAAGRKLLEK